MEAQRKRAADSAAPMPERCASLTGPLPSTSTTEPGGKRPHTAADGLLPKRQRTGLTTEEDAIADRGEMVEVDLPRTSSSSPSSSSSPLPASSSSSAAQRLAKARVDFQVARAQAEAKDAALERLLTQAQLEVEREVEAAAQAAAEVARREQAVRAREEEAKRCTEAARARQAKEQQAEQMAQALLRKAAEKEEAARKLLAEVKSRQEKLDTAVELMGEVRAWDQGYPALIREKLRRASLTQVPLLATAHRSIRDDVAVGSLFATLRMVDMPPDGQRGGILYWLFVEPWSSAPPVSVTLACSYVLENPSSAVWKLRAIEGPMEAAVQAELSRLQQSTSLCPAAFLCRFYMFWVLTCDRWSRPRPKAAPLSSPSPSASSSSPAASAASNQCPASPSQQPASSSSARTALLAAPPSSSVASVPADGGGEALQPKA